MSHPGVTVSDGHGVVATSGLIRAVWVGFVVGVRC